MNYSPLKALLCVWALCFQFSAAETVGLSQVYLQALSSDPQLRVAGHQVALVYERYRQEHGRMLPQVNASISISQNDIRFPDTATASQDYSGRRSSVTLRQSLFDWQLRANKSASRDDVLERQSELVEAIDTLLMQVLERYLQVLLASDNVTLLEAEIALAERQLQAVEKRHKMDLAPITELLKTRSQQAIIRVDAIDARNALAIAKEHLRELTGQQVEQLLPLLDARLLPLVTGSAEDAASKAMKNNPRIAAKRSAQRALNTRIEARQGARLPKVDLVLSHQDSDVGFDNQLTPRRRTGYAGLELSIPLYTGGINTAAVNEARYQKRIADEELDLSQRQVAKAAREAFLNAKSSYLRIEALASVLDSSSEALSAMEKGFELGVVTSIDVLEALREQSKARSDYQSAQYRYVYSYLNLRKETGVLEPGDLLAVSISPVSEATSEFDEY